MMFKIAIIDDAADNREFLYYLLRDDYSVSVYESGEEALTKIGQDPPDLIIMDIWMRGMDGIEALTRIRRDKSLRNVRVITLTANAMVGDREKYLEAGFDAYIAKPILEVGDFLTTLRRLLARSEPK
jgi:two-component system, cell cycle response regulator DivK